jgi:DNA-binding MarR family transcriptional regulator
MNDQILNTTRDGILSQLLESVEQSYPDLDPSMLQASLAILDFSAEANAAVQSHFERYQLSQGRFGILLLLSQLPNHDWTPAQLANYAGVSRATLTGLLHTLEKDEWILRRPSPDDKRSVRILLSSSGERRLNAILPDHFARFSQALATLSLYERLSFLQLLTKVNLALSTLSPNGHEADESKQIPLQLD